MRKNPRQSEKGCTDRIMRVNELLKREIASWIELHGLNEKGTILSVTKVECSPGLKTAEVYISCLGAELSPEVVRTLERRKAEIQDDVSRVVVLKYTPVLNFRPDHNIAEGDRVLALIRKLEEQENNENN